MGNLWQPYHTIQGDPGVTSGFAYVDAGHNVAFEDLGNITFTAEQWIYLPVINYAPYMFRKHTAVIANVGWSLSIATSGVFGGVTYYAPLFSSYGKYYSTYSSAWWWIGQSSNSQSKPESWWLGGWHHISAMSVRADLNSFIDVYIHVDGVLFTTLGYPPHNIVSTTTLYTDTAYDLLTGVSAYYSMGDPNKLYGAPMKVGWSRVSNIARYPLTGSVGDAIFTPYPRLVPPTPDGNTLGLWYFNEGTGVISHNQQGDFRRDAVIYDGIWDANVLTLNI